MGGERKRLLVMKVSGEREGVVVRGMGWWWALLAGLLVWW